MIILDPCIFEQIITVDEFPNEFHIAVQLWDSSLTACYTKTAILEGVNMKNPIPQSILRDGFQGTPMNQLVSSVRFIEVLNELRASSIRYEFAFYNVHYVGYTALTLKLVTFPVDSAQSTIRWQKL